MSSYSPSPWKVEIEEDFWDEDNRVVSVKDVNGELVCNNVDCYPVKVSIDNMEVISISPEMYELLPEIKWQLQCYDNLKLATNPNHGYDDTDKLIDKIDNIIARVK